MYRALHADTSLYDLPRLTAASESLALAEESAVVSVDAVDVQVVVGAVESFSLSADMVYLGNDENRVTFGGITLIASANRSQLELHNHTNKTLSCSFASSQFWLQPSLPSAWLGPHSMLQVSFDSITGVDTSGDSAVLRSSDASVTVREAPAVMLRVNGARLAGSPAPFRLLLPGPVPTAIVGLVSTISMILVFRAHMPASGFYGLNTLAVLVAGSAQWRRRRRS